MSQPKPKRRKLRPIDMYVPMGDPKMTQEKREQRRTRAILGSARRAWTRLNSTLLIRYRHRTAFAQEIKQAGFNLEAIDKYEQMVEELGGDSIIIYMDKNGKKFSISLTGMTLGELGVLRKFLNDSIDDAEPFVKMQDEILQTLHEEYDYDAHTKLYREVPQYIVRKGPVREHGSSLHLRPPGDGEILPGRDTD